MAEKFTFGQVEDESRLILLDTFENAYRFEPKEIYAATKDGLLRLRRERPASRYVGGNLVELEFTYTSGGTTTTTTSIPASPDATFREYEISMEERWREPIVYYVVHRMYQKDDPDTKNDALSSRYFEMYNSAIGG